MAVLFWVVLVMLVFYLVQRLLFSFIGLRSVTYTRTFTSSRLFAGQTVWMHETIANRKRFPIPWLRVESLLPAQLVFKQQEAHMAINRGDQLQNHASLFSIPSYTEIVRKHEISCPRRGKYRITSYTLSLGDVVGVTTKTLKLPADNEIIVFPKLTDMRDFPLDARKYLQSIRSMSSPIMEDHYYVAGVRPYRQGDSFRMVNWSATAKSGEMLVHKRESMRDNDLTIFLNAELMDYAGNRKVTPDDFEEALSYAASAIQYVISGGGKAGFIFNGVVEGNHELMLQVPAKAGAAHLDFLLNEMAGFQPVSTLGLSYALEQLIADRVSGLNYMLITAFIDSKQEDLIGQLRRQGNTVQLMPYAREVVL
jgi:uncharacterized protein (DUF58 family)